MLFRPRRVTFRSLMCVAAGLIGLAVLATGVTLWTLRADTIEDASDYAGNLATVLAEQTARSVQAIDLVLGEIQERFIDRGVRNANDLRRLVANQDVYHLLKERLARLPQADVIIVTDADGQLVNSTRNWPPLEVDLSDRDYLFHLGTNDNHQLSVSAPVQRRLTDTWTIYFSKRINAADGSFIGVISVGIETKYFRHIYDTITPPRNQTFLFVRSDGTVLVRHPEADRRAGLKMPLTSPWYRLVTEGGGRYRSPGYFDGVARLVAVRPLRDYPLVVNVSVPEPTALAKWRHRAMLVGIGTLLAVLCAMLLLKALSNQFHRLLVSEGSLAEREARLAEKSRELEQANVRLDAALNNMSQGLTMFDKDNRLVICNDRYLRMYVLSPENIKPGISLAELLEFRRTAGNFSGSAAQYIADLHTQLARGDRAYVTTLSDDGRVIAVLVQPVAGGGWVATHEDITERQRAEARVAHMARHDALTDLANRVLFREKMEDALARLRRRNEVFSVFVFDLDLFKAVNDSLGHPVGDTLLKAVAQRLRETVRESDTVARLGGDEFAILQTVEADQREAAIVLATRLLKAVCAPYDIDGHQIVIGISIGIALAPSHGADADQLLKNADLALYRTKSEGRNGYRFFEIEMDADARLRHQLEVDLRNAIARDEFELHYQRIVDVATLRVCGVEALVRWRHPRLGLIAPEKFIPLAEEIGTIIPLGEWILRKACVEAANWPAHIKLAVNLSPVQFRTGNLVDVIVSALVESGFPPDRLELEITETVLLQKNVGNIAVLHQLKNLGAGIVLDDFGTGYSSLSYLRMVPFDKIKIDQSFVAELSQRADCAAIVCAVTSLARSLNIHTTAEGVESDEQFDLLRAAGCTQVQGFLFGQPRPAREFHFEYRDRDGTDGEAA